MKITDLVIDPHSLGSEFLLVDVLPAYEYTNGQRTEKIVGYRYTIVLPERRFEKSTSGSTAESAWTSLRTLLVLNSKTWKSSSIGPPASPR